MSERTKNIILNPEYNRVERGEAICSTPLVALDIIDEQHKSLEKTDAYLQKMSAAARKWKEDNDIEAFANELIRLNQLHTSEGEDNE